MAPKTIPRTTQRTIAKIFAGKTFRTSTRLAAVVAVAGLASACGGGSYAAKEDDAPKSGPSRKYNPADETVFGREGLTVPPR